MNDIVEKARKLKAWSTNPTVVDVCDWVLNHKCKLTAIDIEPVSLPCPVCEAKRKANAAYVKKHRSKIR